MEISGYQGHGARARSESTARTVPLLWRANDQPRTFGRCGSGRKLVFVAPSVVAAGSTSLHQPNPLAPRGLRSPGAPILAGDQCRNSTSGGHGCQRRRNSSQRTTCGRSARSDSEERQRPHPRTHRSGHRRSCETHHGHRQFLLPGSGQGGRRRRLESPRR